MCRINDLEEDAEIFFLMFSISPFLRILGFRVRNRGSWRNKKKQPKKHPGEKNSWLGGYMRLSPLSPFMTCLFEITFTRFFVLYSSLVGTNIPPKQICCCCSRWVDYNRTFCLPFNLLQGSLTKFSSSLMAQSSLIPCSCKCWPNKKQSATVIYQLHRVFSPRVSH